MYSKPSPSGWPEATRRRFLRDIALFGFATGVGGCCRLSPLPPADLPDDVLVIDAHCHIFNGWDLDIYNYQVAHLPGYLGILPGLLYSIAVVVRSVAPRGDEELRTLNNLIAIRDRMVRAMGPGKQVEVAEAFAREVKKTAATMAAEIRDRRERVLRGGPNAVLKEITTRIGRGQAGIDFKAAMLHMPEALRRLLEPAVLAFFEPFFQYRLTNAQRLRDIYPMVTLFTPAMMDTDSWFSKRLLRLSDSTPLIEQVDLYERIVVAMQGRMLPFVAFDPRREPSSIPLVKNCINRKCFVGAKLYPPMGYRPFQNVDCDKNPPTNDWPPRLGKKLDDRLGDLFQLCIQEDFSVMAHNNKSQESAAPFKDNGNPKYWRALLETQGYSGLKINLGHFGGMANESGWRDGICDLMERYSGVYGDVGDFYEILCEKKRNKFFSEIRTLTTPQGRPRVLKKLMYGSDFFMNGLYPGYHDYADSWITAFRSNFPIDWTGFVGRNASEFLGLTQGTQQRNRIDSFLQQYSFRPRWVDLVH